MDVWGLERANNRHGHELFYCDIVKIYRIYSLIFILLLPLLDNDGIKYIIL